MLPRRRALWIVPLALVTLAPRPAPAEENFDAQKKAAIEKAIAYLKAQEKPDGVWDYENLHPQLKAYPMSQGIAALGALALLKAGVPPTDPSVQRAFAFLRGQQIEHVYSAGLVLLALEALAHWEPLSSDEGGTTEKKAAPGKLAGGDLDLAQRCVQFLEKTQQKALWRYPSKREGEDSSNAQYALLGLDAAERLGVAVNKNVYSKALVFFVESQEKDGPEVPAFSVPGADLSMAELRKIEKETREKLEKIEKGFKGRKAGEPDAEGHMKEDLIHAAEQDAAKQVFGGTQEKQAKRKMRARGFPYTWKDAEEHEQNPSGSMTASGLVCVFVCKAHLDGTPAWEKVKLDANTALRDGAAWLAKHWSVEKNPNRSFHHDYYLYALERASVLNLIPKFGDHDWYGEGCRVLLKQQQGDGHFDCGERTTVGPVVDTMFGLLFLSRGTTPVIKLPERVVTGVH
jgi:hypothetical protein